MKGTLYCIENLINHKKYIGKTYGLIADRWGEHLRDARKERCSNRPLYRAINKYGAENFKIFSLGEYKQGDLEEAEQQAIINYDTYAANGNGYNATLGGDGTRYLTFTEDEVINSYLKLKNTSEVARLYECDPRTIRDILKKHNIESLWEPSRKSVRIIDLDLTFESLTDAAEYLVSQGYSKGKIKYVAESIRRHICGHRKSYLGMQFEYLD